MENPIFKIKPHFNLVYEMFMPTGRKIRNTLGILIIAIVCYFFVSIGLSGTDISKTILLENQNVDVFGIFNIIAIIIISVMTIKFAAHLIVQILQYNSITYTFYDDSLEYEDSFLNQHKKTLRYDNIKEVEIRRTVWDRINGYGMVIIYSNAEKAADKGLILYSLKDPQTVYTKIDEIIHKKFSSKKEDVQEVKEIKENEKITNVNPADRVTEKEISFKESLNNKE